MDLDQLIAEIDVPPAQKQKPKFRMQLFQALWRRQEVFAKEGKVYSLVKKDVELVDR